MATVEHCLYCFESLVAELEGREPMALDDVQKSYAEYTAHLASDDDDDDDDNEADEKTSQPKKKIPALRRLVGSAPSDNSLPSSTGSASSSSSSTSLSANTDATSITSTTTGTTTSTTLVTDPEAEYPLFVTWNKLSPGISSSSSRGDGDSGDDEGEYDLRGCIGTFEAQPLAAGLSSYAVIAALHDSRFPRVAARELPSLQCAVTLLTCFEDRGAAILDWEVGVHGIRISFQGGSGGGGGRRLGATYLPDVAREQGWTREQALVSLMRKAGWEGPRARWREAAEAGGMKLVRYRGDKEAVRYGEYKAWREWVDEC